MSSDPFDEYMEIRKACFKARAKAEKARDPRAVMKIKKAEKMLEKAENEADKTMDPKLKKNLNELLKKLFKIGAKL